MKEQGTKDACTGRSMVDDEKFSKDMGCADHPISDSKDKGFAGHPIGKKKGSVLRGQFCSSFKKRDLRSLSLSKPQPWCKSVLTLDLSCSMTCTPSYRLLPIKYMRQASSLHPLRAAVLNDHWVCVPANRQNYHLGCIKRNAYEKKLQDCEEECCEVDVCLESTRATIRRMEELLQKLNSSNDISMVDTYLTVLDWQCCNGLLDEYGADMEDKVRQDPQTILPLVIDKLKSKQEKLVVDQERLFKFMKEAFLNKGTKPEDMTDCARTGVSSVLSNTLL